jgi:hypothetical protein
MMMRERGRHTSPLIALLVAVLVGALCFPEAALAQKGRVSSALKIARVKYGGGGDWYNDPSAEVNLLTFLQEECGIETDPRYEFVEPADARLATYPIAFLTGHGNIALSPAEVRGLRSYLDNGGFLYVDDDYGLDRPFRRELERIVPGEALVELPLSHGIYSICFPFPAGPPKTHEHDKNPPRGYGLIRNGRLVLYYTVESNPSDGWADPDVHGDPQAKRIEALQFGANIVLWALTH